MQTLVKIGQAVSNKTFKYFMILYMYIDRRTDNPTSFDGN